ncbi:MAG TPA: 50S ribosomal protein L18 [Candidatus Polarisedimenticolia bacterium]|jgi:large subunit ribosomal protein L18|nr:50S ribosomal protein L18 [Candidatus Polarisedimenticolia bacterium]
MVNEVDRIHSREKRHARVRARLSGSKDRPRLCIYRSLGHIYVQAVDDGAGKTLAHASSLELRQGKSSKGTGNVAAAKKVGTLIAERLRGLGCEKAVFDRGGYLYHGRVKAVADAARAAGLKF